VRKASVYPRSGPLEARRFRDPSSLRRFLSPGTRAARSVRAGEIDLAVLCVPRKPEVGGRLERMPPGMGKGASVPFAASTRPPGRGVIEVGSARGSR